MKKSLLPLLLAMSLILSANYSHAVDTSPSPAENEPELRQEGQLEQKVDEIDRQLDRLEQTLKGARKEAQVQLKKKLPELRLKEKQLKKDIDRLRESSQKAWQELQATLTDMQRAIDRAQKEE